MGQSLPRRVDRRIAGWRHRATLLFLAALLLGPSASYADIVIGMAGPLTGDSAPVGAEMKSGLEAAIADINATGGVLHQKLVLSAEDDACDPRQALVAARRLVERGIRFVFGHYCSATTLVASSVYADSGTLEITTSGSPLITQQGFDGLFRITGRDDQQGLILARYLAAHFSGQRVAILAERSLLGSGLSSAVRTAIAQQGGVAIVFDQAVDIGTKDFSVVIQRLAETKAVAVVYAGYATQVGLLVKQSVEAGLKLQFLSGAGLAHRPFWTSSGPAGEGTIYTAITEAATLQSARSTAERLQAQGIGTQGYTLYAYAAVQLFAQAIERAQSTEPDKVDAELEKGNLPTVLGDYSFDETGDNSRPAWRLYRWTNGKTEYVDGGANSQ